MLCANAALAGHERIAGDRCNERFGWIGGDGGRLRRQQQRDARVDEAWIRHDHHLVQLQCSECSGGISSIATVVTLERKPSVYRFWLPVTDSRPRMVVSDRKAPNSAGSNGGRLSSSSVHTCVVNQRAGCMRAVWHDLCAVLVVCKVGGGEERAVEAGRARSRAQGRIDAPGRALARDGVDAAGAVSADGLKHQ